MDRLAEVVLHTFVAAATVEVLLRAWRVTDPILKIRMRVGILLVPLVFDPALAVLTPFRDAPRFIETWALFAVQRWRAVELLGVGLDVFWVVGCAVVGLALLSADLVPWARRRLPGRARHHPQAPPPPLLLARVQRLSMRLEVAPPRLEYLDTPAVLLSCRGITDPVVVVSRGSVEMLDEQELEGALSHELAHLQHADVLVSWALLAARIVQVFNPMVHVVARGVARDLERRADLAAAEVTGRPLALASGLIKVWRAHRPSGKPGIFERARQDEIEDRCRRLLHPAPAEANLFPGLRLWSAAFAVGALLFFVT